jgi:hypothetical protein
VRQEGARPEWNFLLWGKDAMHTRREKLIRRVALKAIQYDATEEHLRVITVRVPAATHAQLRAEAHDARTSLNLLCVSKLIAAIDGCPILPARFRYQGFKGAQVRDELAAMQVTQETR